MSILKFNACNVQAGLLTWNKVGTGNFNDHYQLMVHPNDHYRIIVHYGQIQRKLVTDSN